MPLKIYRFLTCPMKLICVLPIRCTAIVVHLLEKYVRVLLTAGQGSIREPTSLLPGVILYGQLLTE